MSTDTGNTWTVIPKTLNKHSSQHHKRNKVKTTKYTTLTFLPKNIFEQFHRFANVYFLFIIILNWIPQVNAFGKEIAMFPLIFVLAVTAIKDLIEDRQRYTSDRTVNNRMCDVFQCETSQFLPQKWKTIEVGDIVKLHNNEIIPADILLLNSSDENGICHVSTANLDGENNLKQKQIPKEFLKDEVAFNAKDINFQVKCEQPNNKIYSFCGSIVYENDGKITVNKENLLLRGCVLKNTNYTIGLVVYAGHETKAMLNSSGPRYKRSRLEKDINKDVIACVVILLTFCLIGAIGCGVWTSDYTSFEQVFSTNEAEKPSYEGFLRFWTFIIILQVIIPISLYVSVEIVKLGQVYFMNQDKEMFYAETSQYPVCRATNINEDLGQIQYIFSDKTGTLTENKMLFKRCSIAGKVINHPEGEDEEETVSKCQQTAETLCEEMGTEFQNVWDEFFTALSICNTVVISSQPEITDEHFKLNTSLTGDVIHKPASLLNGVRTHKTSLPNGFHKESSAPSFGNYQTEYKEDRSQTLPFKNTSNVTFSPDVVIQRTLSSEEEKEQQNDDSGSDVAVEYLRIDTAPRVLIYSKVLSDRLSRSIDSINSWLHYGLMPNYEFESPDEGALVKAAACYGYKLADRNPDRIFFTIPSGEIKIFEILHVLPFDSIRKRMSIIVRDDLGKVKMYSKGADTSFMLQLKDGQDKIRQSTDEHLENFAVEGLRTLCVAKRDLSEDEYRKWLEHHTAAELALTDRGEKLAASALAIEQKFHLLGATGIEDRLQEGVPETIASLRNAGIKMWILTGDKQETAVNIGFASKLIDSDMELITVNSKTKNECNELLDQVTQRINSRWPSYTVLPTLNTGNHNSGRLPLALIIDGHTLSFALDSGLDKKFIDIAKQCESVICCRSSPVQKAAVVRLVRDNLKVMSLAIGDGANDVSMLQVAEIGVGIVGEEGVQAVMASDFVLGRFRFLQRLLLLHGFWCYDRIARMIIYFFYKNAMFVCLLFWYQLFNGFSGSNAIDDISLILYNLAFTSLPPIITGIFDQCLVEKAILQRPLLYQWGQFGKAYSRKLFWIAICDSIFQSLILFFGTYLTFYGLQHGMMIVGITFHQIAIITATLHIAIETPNWTVIHTVVIIGSAVLSFLYFFVYCASDPLLNVYWAIYESMATAEFWFACILLPFVAVLPRLMYRILEATLFPSVIQRVRNYFKTHDEEKPKVETRTFSENSFRPDDGARIETLT